MVIKVPKLQDVPPALKAVAPAKSFFFRRSSPSPDPIQVDGDDEEIPRKRAKTSGSPATVEMVEDAWQSILALKAKVLSARSYFKNIEACASSAGVILAAHQHKLEKVKVSLGM